MPRHDSLASSQSLGTGLSFIVPSAGLRLHFAVHPGLLNPHLLSPAELIARAHGADLLQFGHALVTLNTALLVVVALHFMGVLAEGRGAWAGFISGAVAVLGLCLAADKGALCLTMSSLNGLGDAEFAGMMPGLLAMFSLKGWMVLLWGIVLLPVGFGIQAVALLTTKALPRWQALLFLVGVLFIGVPDGIEVVNLTASILLSIALVPYGARLMLLSTEP
ncbi:MAG: hypothetical protein R2882_11620 [Gemmatimonadales bacterium]